MRLYNNANPKKKLKLDEYIRNWGGGIGIIRRCCSKRTLNPRDKDCDWDTLVDLCCINTPPTHHVWLQFLEYNKLKITNDPILNLKCLLAKWVDNGYRKRMYGAYPIAEEQEFYVQDTIPSDISEILNYAIISDVFEDAFIAMDKCKRLQPSTTQQASSFVSSIWSMMDKSIAEFVPFGAR